MKRLRYKGKLRDGGSFIFIDKETREEYFICHKFGENNKKYYGKLFKGNIDNFKTSKILAKGTFLLESNRGNEIIKQ